MCKKVLALAGVMLCAALVALWAYWALKQIPVSYHQALEIGWEQQQLASREMTSRAVALFNDTRNLTEWQAQFTAEQINGWLAVDLAEKHPDWLPQSIGSPRVTIHPGVFTCSFHADHGTLSTVLSIEADIYVSKPNVIACRLRGVHAGTLPMPLKTVIDWITQAARHTKVSLRWGQINGDPVALITLTSVMDFRDEQVVLEELEVGQGSIALFGRTHWSNVSSAQNAPSRQKRIVSRHSVEKRNRQR